MEYEVRAYVPQTENNRTPVTTDIPLAQLEEMCVYLRKNQYITASSSHNTPDFKKGEAVPTIKTMTPLTPEVIEDLSSSFSEIKSRNLSAEDLEYTIQITPKK